MTNYYNGRLVSSNSNMMPTREEQRRVHEHWRHGEIARGERDPGPFERSLRGLGAGEGLGTVAALWMLSGVGVAAVVGGIAGYATHSWKVALGVGAGVVGLEVAAYFADYLYTRQRSAAAIAAGRPT